MVLRLAVSDALEYDEAEILFYFQQPLAFGYNSQPPLYNWLQIGLFRVFGLNVFSLALLKNSLIFLFYFVLYKFAHRILKSEPAAVLSTASLFLIYNFSWLLHKDLTHSVLLLVLCAASFYNFYAIFSQPQKKYYLWLGLVMGLGILAKYNYIVFILALFLSGLSIAEYRKSILCRKMILSLLLCVAIVGPHLAWAIANVKRVTLDVVDFNIAGSGVVIPFKGLSLVFSETLIFLLPLLVFYAIFFPQGFKKSYDDASDDQNVKRWLERFFLFSALLILVCVIASRVQHIKIRWLHPFLFLVPLYFFIRFGNRAFRSLRTNIFLGIVVFCAVSTLFSISGRIFFASNRGKYVRLNYPYRQLAAAIRKNGFNKGLIVAENHVMGGDLKLYFPDSLVVVPDKRFWVDTQKTFDSILIVWENNDGVIPQALQEQALRFGYDTSGFSTIRERQLYQHSRDAYYELNIAIGHRREGS